MTSAKRPAFLTSRASFIAWFKELAKFGAVGGVAWVVNAGLYNLLVSGPGQLFSDQVVRASMISSFISIVVAWLGNRYWTFGDKRNQSKGKEAMAFLAVNIVGMLIEAACLYVNHWWLNHTSAFADNLAKNIIGVGLGTIFRYFCYKFIIFRDVKSG